MIRAGSGLDNIDLEYARNRGLELIRIPGPGAQSVAELAFGLMLNLARQVVLADRLLRQGRWAKHELTGYLLTGKRLGIIGTGNIGSRVGWLGAAWGMDVIGCVEHPSSDRARELQAMGIRLTDMDEVLRTADFVTVHVPLKDATHHLIDAQALARMKPGAFLTNLARGGVVDEAALYRALSADGGVAGAGMDVHECEGEGVISPLAMLPNVVLTPHIGAMAIDAQRQIGERVIEIVEASARQNGSSRSDSALAQSSERGSAHG